MYGKREVKCCKDKYISFQYSKTKNRWGEKTFRRSVWRIGMQHAPISFAMQCSTCTIRWYCFIYCSNAANSKKFILYYKDSLFHSQALPKCVDVHARTNLNSSNTLNEFLLSTLMIAWCHVQCLIFVESTSDAILIALHVFVTQNLGRERTLE